MSLSPFGTWTYRSLINNSDINATFNSLEFGRATLVLEDAGSGKLTGSIGGPGWSLAITGIVLSGMLSFEGTGNVSGERWDYAYQGMVIPSWPNGVGQIDAMVGSTVRVLTHSKGKAKAGYVATWYAVRLAGS